MRKYSIIGICCTLFLTVVVATQASANTWDRRIRNDLQAMPWATIVDVKSPCQIVVRTNGVAVAIRLSGIEPIPVDEQLGRTQVVHSVAEYIYGLTNSRVFYLVLDDQQPENTGSSECLGNLWVYTGHDFKDPTSLQFMLVVDGYARPRAGADEILRWAYAIAQKEKKGLWALLADKQKGRSQSSEANVPEVAPQP